jgi:hypothetical protein
VTSAIISRVVSKYSRTSVQKCRLPPGSKTRSTSVSQESRLHHAALAVSLFPPGIGEIDMHRDRTSRPAALPETTAGRPLAASTRSFDRRAPIGRPPSEHSCVRVRSPGNCAGGVPPKRRPGTCPCRCRLRFPAAPAVETERARPTESAPARAHAGAPKDRAGGSIFRSAGRAMAAGWNARKGGGRRVNARPRRTRLPTPEISAR